MLYWGRNVVYTTEAVYHVLMLGTWLALLDRRWRLCLACTFLIATTHPFAGAQALGILLTWSVLNWTTPRLSGCERVPVWFVGALAVVSAVFLGYYFGFLPRFPQHCRLLDTWALGWSEAPLETVAAYGPVVLLAAVGFVRRCQPRRFETALLLTAAAVSFGLSHHHWWIEPHQPLHFTHGYVWLPLYLLGVPLLGQAVGWAAQRPGRLAVAGALAIGLCADNVAWLAVQACQGTSPGHKIDVRFIDDELRIVYHWMNEEGLRGTLLSDSMKANYLAATYTACRPYVSHRYNTPDYGGRIERVWRPFRRKQAGLWSREIDLFLTLRPMARRDVISLYEGKRWFLYRRTGTQGTMNGAARQADK
jgi:hypothetical protein